MFFNNCCSTKVSLIKFQKKHFEQVNRCLNQWKNKRFRNNRLITLPGSAFLCLRQSYISNCNNRWITFAHAGIFLFFMQRINEHLVALKDFDYSCSLEYINGQLRQKVNDVMYLEMNVAKSLNFMI